ncbi:MAG: substrate-binding domain-containing protein [Treponema sp.]|nr:substrate-binding domain-containing protein [Treponema sp.]
MRIGLVLDILDEEYQISMYKGMKKRAEELGIEFVCFQLEHTQFKPGSFIYNFHYNNLLNVDGLVILTAVITDHYRLHNQNDIQEIWGNIPVISAGQIIEGIPSINISTESSMKKIVEHLIIDHNHKNIMFVGGLENHKDNIEREQVFKKSIEHYKKIIPDLNYTTIRGNFTEGGAFEALSSYTKKKDNLKIDAIVCANDNMAIGINKYLKINKTKLISENCAITGFDDIPQAKLEMPPLTTVRQPMKKMGTIAIDSIIKLINGEELPPVTTIHTDLIIRESCNCKPSRQNKTEDVSTKTMQKNYLKSEQMLRMVSHMCQDLNYVYSFDSMNTTLEKNLELFDVRTFCIFLFETKPPYFKTQNKALEVTPLYIRLDSQDITKKYNKKINIQDFFETIQKKYGKEVIFKFLSSGESIIGCTIYKTQEDDMHQYLCSMITTVAQTILRLKSFAEKEKRSEFLEEEISKRTKELIEANNRRIQVEAEVLKITEIERQRFSTDLHDDICQRLAGISMLCKCYSTQNSPVKKEQMEELTQLISETLQRTRQYAHDSYPVDLESLGMNNSISNLCNSFKQQTGTDCIFEWDVSSENLFNKIEKLNIFRIIQEALHNIMKHAHATKTIVKVIQQKDCVIITINDNGEGFSSDNSDFKKGVGFNSMQYRANQINAKFQIKSIPQKGTTIEIKMQQK